ncbi:hypothetical protein AB205_0069550 [Aquarana catesbeiana]|uniref:Uncharacterized protein n=1 Tax=Aquarana catesbeiana TaxID=8400 RepID=A0A2G9P2A6_AQUCT|nr:hypothetical protein AB205_0069550 [Aquarana catesbeiana]
MQSGSKKMKVSIWSLSPRCFACCMIDTLFKIVIYCKYFRKLILMVRNVQQVHCGLLLESN